MKHAELLTAHAALCCPELWAAPDIPLLPAPDARKNLAVYIDLLLKWNNRLNLSGCHDALSLIRNLAQDSFFLAAFLDRLFAERQWHDPVICDLGAGAGLPGVPLRLVWNAGAYYFIESREKRALFLDIVLGNLNLRKDRVYHGLAENFFAASQYKPQCILSRAFKPWPQLLHFCRPYLAPDGFLIIMSNEPPPHSMSSWRLASCLSYDVLQKTRWLWALTPA